MIKAGDLVMVVRACCAVTLAQSGGLVGTVNKIEKYPDDSWLCENCGETGHGDMRVIAFRGRYRSAPTSWLKKIDPPATGEYDRVPQRLKEPA